LTPLVGRFVLESWRAGYWSIAPSPNCIRLGGLETLSGAFSTWIPRAETPWAMLYNRSAVLGWRLARATRSLSLLLLLDEFQFDRTGQDPLIFAPSQELPDRFPSARTIIERIIVDIHADEFVGLIQVQSSR
jgi:hypothetical protein